MPKLLTLLRALLGRNPPTPTTDQRPGPAAGHTQPAPDLLPNDLAFALATGRPVLLLGDSLSDAARHPPGNGWVDIFNRTNELHITLENHAFPGATLQAARGRLPRLLAKHRPAVVLLALGHEDALRQAPPTEVQADLMRLATTCQAASALPIFVRPLAPPSPPDNGRIYRAEFATAFERASAWANAPLVRGWIETVAGKPELFEPDLTYPNTRAQRTLAHHIDGALARMHHGRAIATPRNAA